MSADPFRDAVRARLAEHRTTAGIAWEISDTLNTTTNPDASIGYLTLEFPGGQEEQYTFGAPGSDLFKEQGQITLQVVAPLGRNRSLAETYAAALRDLFRLDRITVSASQTCRITSTGAMGGGHDEAGMWVENVALGYEIYNVG